MRALLVISLILLLLVAGCINTSTEKKQNEEAKMDETPSSQQSASQGTEKNQEGGKKIICKSNVENKKEGQNYKSTIYIQGNNMKTEFVLEEESGVTKTGTVVIKEEDGTTNTYLKSDYFMQGQAAKTDCEWILFQSDSSEATGYGYNNNLPTKAEDYVDYINNPINIDNGDMKYEISCDYGNFAEETFETKGKICTMEELLKSMYESAGIPN